MYTVLLDGAYLYHPKLEDYKLTDAVLDLEVNTSGSLEFTIFPSHPLFGAIKRLKSVVEVYDDGELIFRGRPLNDTYKIDKSQTILCEGDLAFLNDSQMPPYSHTGSIEDLLMKYINNHNSQVTSDRQFTLGHVTVTDPNNTIVRSSINYVNTWQEVKSKLIDSLGGYIRVRRLGDVNYIDYLHDSLTISGQSIELTKNMLDYQQTIDVSEIATVIIPLGAKLTDEEGNELDDRLTIGSVNNGKDYIEHTAGISKYGKIWTVQVWDDVTTPQILKDRGTSSLNTLVNLGVNIEIKAIDLNLIDKTESKLRFFDYVRIISKPHEVDEEMLIKKQTINLNDPSQNVITVGTQFATFTEKQLRNDNIIRIIESNYVTNETVGEIRQLTTILQSSITQNAETIHLETLERIETNRVISERVSDIELSVDGIRLEVSQLGGYNIISNIIGKFGTLDWTFESTPFIAQKVSPFAKTKNDSTIPTIYAINNNGTLVSTVEVDTKSKSGFRFWHSGKMLSQLASVDSGTDYSIHLKTKGTGSVTVKLREYTSSLETNKNNYHKETTLGTTSITTNWATFERTLTIAESTMAVCLVFESNVNVYLQEYATLSDGSFNIGQPKPYGQSLTDVNNRVDSLGARVEIAEDTVDIFTTRVSSIEGLVDSHSSQLTIQAGEISSKVDSNGIISSINQTSETVKINASKINLAGYVTISSLSVAGSTTINGGNITTGTINASNVSITNINASNITAGTLNASRIGAGTIVADKISVGKISDIAVALGTMSSGAVNNGSFSYGSFGGTGNFPSGTLAGQSYYDSGGSAYITYLSSFQNRSRWAVFGGGNGASQSTLQVTGLIYSNGSLVTSDIRTKDNFTNVDDKFNEFIYSLPIGTYTFKGSEKPQIGINANLVDNLFPDEVTKYLINQDERGMYSANYIALVPMLVKVVQEQHHRLIDLEYRLSELERMMA